MSLTSGDVSTALSFVPLDAATVIGAVNASSATIDDRRLTANIVRQDFPNIFPAQQTFASGLKAIGAAAPAATALIVEKGLGSSSAVDIRLDGQGNALRVFSPGISEPRTYFNDAGMFYTNGWMVISGTYHGQGDGYALDHPSPDPFMLGVWSDIPGPAVQLRGSSAPNSYLLSGLDQAGNYAFSVEQNGGLKWGASNRLGMDTSLYRDGVANLRTNGGFSIGTAATIGGNATVGGRLAVSSGMVSLGDAQIWRYSPGGLSTGGAFLVNGPLNLGAVDTQLYRQAAGTVRTDGSLSVGGNTLLGGPLFVGAADSTIYRNGPASLRTNSSMTLDGSLAVGRAKAGYPLYVL